MMVIKHNITDKYSNIYWSSLHSKPFIDFKDCLSDIKPNLDEGIHKPIDEYFTSLSDNNVNQILIDTSIDATPALKSQIIKTIEICLYNT